MTVYSIFSQATPVISGTGSSTGTFTVIFTLAQPAALTGIWVYSSNVDSALPGEIGIFDMATGTLVTGTHNTSPAWSGTLGSGWVKCAYDGSVTLDTRARGYCAGRLVIAGAVNHGYSNAVTFPVTSGILTAPAEDVTSGLFNGPFNTAAPFSFPNSSGGAGPPVFDWLVDVEVTSGGLPAATAVSRGGNPRLTETYRSAR